MYGSSLRSPEKMSRSSQKMESSEPKSFRSAMLPAIRSCWIFGIGIFEYPIGHPHPMLSFCWSISHLILYSFLTTKAQVPVISSIPESTVTLHNYHLSTWCCVNFIIIAMIMSWKGKTIRTFHHRIGSVNENLRKFGIAEDYGITYKYQIKQLVVCLVHIIITSVVDFAVEDNASYWQMSDIAFHLSFLYQLILICVVGCLYCGCIRYIGNRFQHLNAHLLQSISDGRDNKSFLQNSDYRKSRLFLITHEIHGDLRPIKAANQKWTVQVLREARSIHRDLCITAKEMNQAFGIHIIFFMGIAFCNLTSFLFTINQILVAATAANIGPEIVELIPICCRLFIYMTAIYYLVYCCSTVSCEAQQTSVVIHDRDKPDISTEIQAEIEVFTLQLMQDPLEFTAYGFFTLDYTVIRGMVGSVTTYLVIMIQMRAVKDANPDLNSVTNLTNNYTI